MEQSTEVRKPQNGLQRAINIIVSPVKVIEDIKAKPNYLVPMIIIWVVTLGSTLLLKDLSEQLKDLAYANLNMPPEQIAAAKEMASGFVKVGMYVAVIGAPLAAIFKGAFAKLLSILFSGKGSLGETVSLVLNAYMIQILGTIISIPLMLITQNGAFSFSPALLLPMTKFGTPFYNTLMYFNIFSIWYLAVTVVGIKKIHEVATWKAVLITLIPLIILIAFSWIGVLSGAPSGL